MRNAGIGGNLNITNIDKLHIILLYIVHHFTWKLLEYMTDRFPRIPDFAWISHALPLNGKGLKNESNTNYNIVENSLSFLLE